jgi:hypothetical protein
MAVSEDVLRLVRTVERLPREDQDKIFRIVDLLSLVPFSVQDRTQQMLRELLAQVPASKHECHAGIDEVIEYLERNASMSTEFRGLVSRYDSHVANLKARVS